MTSRLTDAASPYLRSHADHPVAWFAWGEEAFAAARRRDVPVFISIGYSTCHWCHVMARESFADPSLAEALNAGFVAIKVDREEHPEVDAAYLAQASAFTARLGWPLSIFATPDGQAFHAGTYWPAISRDGMPAFGDVLAAVSEAWCERRDGVEATASAVARALSELADAEPSAPLVRADVVGAVDTVLRAEDPTNGGFGSAGAKFPLATVLRFLQARAVAESSEVAPDVAAFALRAMRGSELFDEVEGGFFRYATRPDWTAPHYERMLVDNAQLIEVAIAAGDTDTAVRTATFLRDVLLQPSGGFGAAQDAESVIDGEPSEGGYYALSADDRAVQAQPLVDAKVVTGWNGLAIAALARLSLHTGTRSWATLAADAAASVIERNLTSHGWVRASVGDIASRAKATPADLAQLAIGLTALSCATGEVAHAVMARELVDTLRDGTEPRLGGGDAVLQALGVAQAPDSGDGDEPSAGAALALAALQLADLGAGEGYRALAEAIMRERWPRAAREPLAYGATLQAAARLISEPQQTVVVTDRFDDPLVHAANGMNADVLAVVTPKQAAAFAAAGFSLFEGRTSHALYACEGFVCALPITDVSQLGSANS